MLAFPMGVDSVCMGRHAFQSCCFVAGELKRRSASHMTKETQRQLLALRPVILFIYF